MAAQESQFIAALPMYDWPERRDVVDRQWAEVRRRLQAAGIDAPQQLVRRNADMPGVPGGIQDADGNVIAPDPTTLDPDGLDLHTLWRHPSLLWAQTCWGPMGLGLARHVQVIGEPDYSEVEGGDKEFYRSAVVARRTTDDVPVPSDGDPYLQLDRLRGKRLAFNSKDSMSGIIGLTHDLTAVHGTLDVFSERLESGGHRQSITAVAEGRADVAAIDCLTWQLAKQFEPAAAELGVIGWTARRKGLPFIASRHIPSEIIDLVRSVESDHRLPPIL
ncbi:ABC-type phosphate/phosphonate transport system, periplasmic component [Xylariaceae sp. FL1019]|nr:ABC-type phosphate/phosphonate transport system, periplasmic component [Xylariaceae sp. FL1019]